MPNAANPKPLSLRFATPTLPRVMNPQLKKHNPIRLTASLMLLALYAVPSVFGANGTWTNAPVSGAWNNITNWNGVVVPGAINNTVNNGTDTSVATFTNPVTTFGGVANPVIIDDGTVVNGKARMLGKIAFDTATCGAYVFYSPSPYAAGVTNAGLGTGSPETGVLSFCVPAPVNQSATNGMYMTATVTQPQTFLVPVQIRLPSSTGGMYGFTNDATSSTATLFFNSIFLYPGATSRGVTYIFAGSNTGTNTVASLSQSANQTGSPSGIRKEGTGRWIFSGANTFNTGSPMNIVGGTLEVQHPNAFGSSSAITVTNAVLQIDGVTLAATSVGLKNGGTIRMNGSGTVGGIAFGQEPASSMTLATTTSGDVLTINTLTSGAADGVVHVAGPGTIQFSADSAVTNGTWSLDAGVAMINSTFGMGALPKTLAFGAGSTGKLQLNGYNYVSLALTSNPTLGSPIVENGSANPSVLTVSNVSAGTFAGVLRDGAGGGSLALTKNAIGTLTLAGANTYTGNTTINLGAINLTGSLGSSAVTVTSGGTLMGNGAAGGVVEIQGGGTLAPGNVAVGNLTVSSLTLDSGSIGNFEFNTNPTNDQVVVTSSGGLTINGGSINLYQEGTLSPYTTAGTYKLFKFSGAIGGSGVGSLSVGNQQPGFTYLFGTAGGYVVVTIGVSSAVLGTWNVDADGTWTDGTKWNTNPNIPHSAGDSATFGVGSSLRTVTLNANEKVGGVTFTNNNSFVVTGGNTLTLDNSGSPTSISALAGTTNAIQTAVALNDNVTTTVSSGKVLSLSGTIANGANGSKAMTIAGSGTLSVSGNNTYGPAAGSVGTTISGNGVTVKLGHSSALGAGDVNMTASGTLQANAAALNVANNIAVASLVSATVDNNGNNLTLAGTISGGGNLTKVGAGTLTLSGGNSYSGSTAVKAGALSISSDSNLGAAPGAETPNSIVLDGGRLLGTATIPLGQGRDVGIGPVSGSTGTNALIDAAGGTALTVGGVIASAGNTGVNGLTVNGAAGSTGTVILSGANTFNGQTYIDKGALELVNALALQNSVLDYTNGTLLFDASLTSATIGNLAGTQNMALTNLSGAGVALTLGGDNGDTYYLGSFMDTGFTSGNGSLTKNGTGTLTLAGSANSLSGTMNINAGIATIPTGGSLNNSNVNVGSAALLLIAGGTANFTGQSTINGGGANGLYVSNGLASFGSIRSQQNDGSLILVGGGTLNTSDINLRRTFNGTTVRTTDGLVITNGQANVGTIEVGTLNSWAQVNITGGSLLTTGAVTVAYQTSGGRGGVVFVSGGRLTVLDTTYGMVMVRSNGTAANNQNAILNLNGGVSTLGALTFGYDASVPTNSTGTVTVSTNAQLYIGAGGIIKNADATYTNTININGGTLGVTASQTIGNIFSFFNINSSGTVQPIIRCADEAGAAKDITLNAVIGGNGTLTKTGNGTLTLASVGNFYTGGVILNAGTLNINSTWQLGGGVYGGFTFNGGTLQYAATPMNGALDITHDTSTDGTNGVVKLVTLSSNAVIDVNGNTVAYANSIGNAGNGGLTVKSSTPGGVLNLQGVNNYKGNTVVSSGTLELATASLYTGASVSVSNSAIIKLDFAGANNVSGLVLGGVTKAPGTYNSANSSPYITGTGSLVVPSAVNTNPTNITYTVSGSTLTLSWPADHTGWTLQAQTNNASTGLTTSGWVDVPGSTSVNSVIVNIDPTKPTVFYRMKY
jgi:autotransporter-associated beta strand protein